MPPGGSVWGRLAALEHEMRTLRLRVTSEAGGGVPAALHATEHYDGGDDEVDVTQLGGFPGGSPKTYLDSDGAFTDPTGSGYTDEQAQDAVGGILSDVGDIDFTYDDATPAISAILKTTATPQVSRLGIGAAADANAALKVVGQLWIPLVDDGNSGAAKTINWNDGNEHLLTLTDNVTLTLNNPKDGGRYVIVLLQDGTGGRTVTWPAAVKWPAGVTPTITATASRYDLVTLIYLSGAGIYLASINQNYSA